MKCQNCGTEIERKFCSNCGAPAPVENNQPTPPQTPPQQPQQSYQPYQDADMIIGRPPNNTSLAWKCGVGALVFILLALVAMFFYGLFFGGKKDVQANIASDVSAPAIIDSSEESSEDADAQLVRYNRNGLSFFLPAFAEQDTEDDYYYFYDDLFVAPSIDTNSDRVYRINSNPGKDYSEYIEILKTLAKSLSYSDIVINGVPALDIEYVSKRKHGDGEFYTRTLRFYNKSAVYTITVVADDKTKLEPYEADFNVLIDTILCVGDKATIPDKISKLIDNYEKNVPSVSSTPPASSAPVASSAPQAPTSSTVPASSAPAPAAPKQDPVSSAPPPTPAAGATIGQENALAKANSYLRIMAFSYQGLIEQLEYNKFSNADATYAANNCGADWNQQALAKANSYLNTMAFSYQGLIEQLEHSKFTSEQATYGANNCGADWNEQAATKAKSYLDIMSFSREDLIDQLIYNGFTYEQAAYGASAAGY